MEHYAKVCFVAGRLMDDVEASVWRVKTVCDHLLVRKIKVRLRKCVMH